MLTYKWLRNPQNLEDAFFIREAVFMKEQGFRGEFDERDNSCDHLVLYEDGRAVACARLFPEQDGSWHVGRIAVVQDRRGRDLGSRVLAEAERRARDSGGKRMILSAQLQAKGFYEKQGYRTVSGEYLDEHCPHVDMVKELGRS